MAESQDASLGISRPGRNEQLIAPSEAVRRNPEFTTGWTLRIRHSDGSVEEMAPGTDWEAISERYGAVRSAVVTDPEGNPQFDRPRYDEAPNINVVAYGRDKETGQLKIGIISQARPHADDIFEKNSTEAPKFAQIPMGFRDKIIGKDQVERLEATGESARRETIEETGAQAVLDISYPEYPNHYPNPTFVGTSSDLVFVEVDLDKIEEMKIDRSEGIFQAEYIPLDKLIQDIKAGKNEHGYTRMATANSALLVFLSGLSSIQHADSNARQAAQSHRDELADAIAEANLPHGASYADFKKAREEVPAKLDELAADPDTAFRKPKK